MLKFYLTTVVIWMIIIDSIILLTKDMIVKNGWLDGAQSKKNRIKSFTGLFCLSAVPIFRFFVAIMLVVMSAKTKEEIDIWTTSNKK